MEVGNVFVPAYVVINEGSDSRNEVGRHKSTVTYL